MGHQALAQQLSQFKDTDAAGKSEMLTCVRLLLIGGVTGRAGGSPLLETQVAGPDQGRWRVTLPPSPGSPASSGGLSWARLREAWWQRWLFIRIHRPTR